MRDKLRRQLSEANETTEMWREVRQEQQARRAVRLPVRSKEIQALEADGFQVRQLTPYQFRVNEAVDLYPTHRRYHVLSGNRRGTYRVALSFIRAVLRPAVTE